MSDEIFENDNIENNVDPEDNGKQEYSTDATYSMDQDNKENQYSFTNHDIIQDHDYSKNTNDNQGNTASEYSFWAEEVASSTQHAGASNNIFDMSSQDGTNTVKPNFIKKAVKFVFRAAVFGLIAGAAFIGSNFAYYKINPEATPLAISFGDGKTYNISELNMNPPANQDKKIAATTVSNGVIQQKTDITDVVDKTMPSIVTITSTYKETYDWFGEEFNQENEGGGSGIIVGENDTELLIATNNHVVEGASKILVNFIDNSQMEAIIKGTDATADLAVITIDKKSLSKKTLDAIEVAKLGDSKSVKVGQMAVAIGNALGYGQSVTVGYVSAKDREVQVNDKKMVLLQTDAAINPGNSGGALLNLNGEVIGINSVKYASSEVEGMGYAIPISRAMPIINELMNREILKDEEKGYLGVHINDVTEDIAQMYNWPVGVYVTSTVEGGGAANAGIISGDIITGVNGTEITSSTQLQEKITSYKIGTEVKLTVMRSTDGEYAKKEITVILGKKPEEQ